MTKNYNVGQGRTFEVSVNGDGHTLTLLPEGIPAHEIQENGRWNDLIEFEREAEKGTALYKAMKQAKETVKKLTLEKMFKV